MRLLLADVLEDLGYGVVEAADGMSGLRLLQSDMRIDLLISDIGLPGGNERPPDGGGGRGATGGAADPCSSPAMPRIR